MRQRQFEEVLRDGVSAAKSGQRSLAQRLLTRATLLNSADARPYLWLSATTDDLKEQREYLEQAVACDPNNVSARRGLAILTGKIDATRLMAEGAALEPALAGGESEAQSQSFQCPQCGGRMSFSVQLGLLKCEYCGYVKIEDQSKPTDSRLLDDWAEQVLEFVMPTTRGHRWAEAQHRLSCEHCGAVSLLAPGERATQCAYCGSNQLIDSTETAELVDPQAIALMKIEEQQATQRVKDWLGRGVFAPDNLRIAHRGLRLRPAYYSFWAFDGTLEARWACEVSEGSGRYKRWVPVNGVEAQFFTDVLVPGVRTLTWNELEGIEPFDLVNLEEFKPEYLAGWPAIIYDRSLSDASLLARERVMKKMRSQVYDTIMVGRDKRNIQISGSNWSGMTFKHILLPVWIGTYHYKGQEYHLLVNGQTGKVGGVKPRDTVKLALAILIAMGLVIFLVILYLFLRSPGGGL